MDRVVGRHRDDPEDVDRWCWSHADSAFTLDEAPLFRIRLGRRGPGRWVLLVVLSHVICDDWSLGILWRELAELYAGRFGSKPELGAPSADYLDFARREHQQLNGERRASLEQFWRTELGGVPLRRRCPLTGRGRTSCPDVVARNELYFVLVPSDDRIDVVVEYSTDLFDDATVAHWVDEFVGTLAELTGNPRTPLPNPR
ncbi:hypothetical protein ALI22I_09825 [Saccharothrix sp. ALI-22-I]|uniref:condensation domain-containing protein n=1 Tax=Saccharothrix sp. ALI-22-I TaxID=1933778 RepID=UPI00097C3C7B|nr:condensation domain-containing protein [Saccharothrix sp. ALI-22-I]ONI91071.1 hypothetical protein ALI22I_09825 [Saccharothrix sp. ALI-22-I]